ncbi:MAG TPA: hypothetical protein VKU83_07705, partial [Puia sp.]|nr:hypothetical protein [Puia sp.]
MKKQPLNTFTFLFILALCLFATIVFAAPAPLTVDHTVLARKMSRSAAQRAEKRMILATATSIYDEMSLEDSGLSRKAFEYAWTGFYKLRKRGLLKRAN